MPYFLYFLLFPFLIDFILAPMAKLNDDTPRHESAMRKSFGCSGSSIYNGWRNGYGGGGVHFIVLA
jgi:hypothetical protein